MAFGRKLARMEERYLALVPVEARIGDSVGLFKGGETPLVIRPVGDLWQRQRRGYQLDFGSQVDFAHPLPRTGIRIFQL
jgi:hypothetical protein